MKIENGITRGQTNGTNGNNIHTGSGDDTTPQPQFDNIHSSAIDAVFTQNEQTYEQLMQSFTQLTPDDLDSLLPQGNSTSINSQALGHTDGQHDNNTQNIEAVSTNAKQSSDDELEEQVLEEGERVPGLMMRQTSSDSKIIKFDNFVEDEGGDRSDSDLSENEENTILTSGYLASFGSESKDETIPDLITSRTEVHPPDGAETKGENSSEDIFEVIKPARKFPEDSDSDEELIYNPLLDKPNPGEVEDEEKSETIKPKERLLEFKVQTSSGPTTEEQNKNAGEEDEDAVEPFRLDDEFDYDNVTLTPKFTAQEMAYLASCAPQQQ